MPAFLFAEIYTVMKNPVDLEWIIGTPLPNGIETRILPAFRSTVYIHGLRLIWNGPCKAS